MSWIDNEMSTKFTKSRYKIGEASELIGVPQTTLRFWEQEFPKLAPKRSRSNQRYYTPSDLEMLEMIKFLLHTKGMKVEAAREYLRNNSKDVSKKLEIIEQLETVKSDLKILYEALTIRLDAETSFK